MISSFFAIAKNGVNLIEIHQSQFNFVVDISTNVGYYCCVGLATSTTNNAQQRSSNVFYLEMVYVFFHIGYFSTI